MATTRPTKKSGNALLAKSLGHGSGSLQGLASEQEMRLRRVGVDRLRPNPDQPRRSFDEAKLAELADSIRANGLISPPVVSRQPDGSYMIVAGERRWRAVQRLGWTEMDVIEVDEGSEVAALVENIQRENLTPLEEARGLQRLAQRQGPDQNQTLLAASLGKPKSYVSETLGLLRLEEAILEHPLLAEASRSALVELSTLPAEAQLALWRSAAAKGAPVTTQQVRAYKGGAPAPSADRQAPPPAAKPLRAKGWEKILTRIDEHLASGAPLGRKEREAAERLQARLAKLLEG
ncbi:MAG TPA: ParB/RepB/Spo0J family partition protein [Azospirillaceae bacterium]|nr:ParB/RepB/Spo0J family partition protein [Azospirillaceae bacterium]